MFKLKENAMKIPFIPKKKRRNFVLGFTIASFIPIPFLNLIFWIFGIFLIILSIKDKKDNWIITIAVILSLIKLLAFLIILHQIGLFLDMQ